MAEFWAGYISGVAGIIIGSPLDIIKVRHQAHAHAERHHFYSFGSPGSLIRGAAAPILGYGALNALLFASYSSSLELLGDSPLNPSSFWRIWMAGAASGFVSFVISTPTELVKCRAQLSTNPQSSWSLTRDIIRTQGFQGLYLGGTVTSLRDSIGYGFYFYTYEGLKSFLSEAEDSGSISALKTLLCGGIAGCATWLSIYPLDVVKTQVQTQIGPTKSLLLSERLEVDQLHVQKGAWACARATYGEGGPRALFKGLGVCMVRAFLVNAVQWAIYEWIMVQYRSA